VEVFHILKDWTMHQQYQELLMLHLLVLWYTDRERIANFDKSISKLYHLNLDKLFPIVSPLYSNTGRPAKNQQGIIRSLVLMPDMVYENNLFVTTASDSPYDLSIYLRKAQAQRHDSTIAIFVLDEVRKLYPEITFKNYIANGVMDNYPTYKLLQHYNMIPFIHLDSDAKFPDKNLPVKLRR
jgi:hypothetical protein